MSLYSYSTILSSSSSITTVSNPPANQVRILTSDDEQWPIVQHPWQIEKNVHMKKLKPNSCILKATMTKEQTLVHDYSTNQSIALPDKHISMKVVFRF